MITPFVCSNYKEYIKNAQAPKIQPGNLPLAIIVDLDGTMAFSPHREWWDNNKVKDDQVNWPLAYLISLFYEQKDSNKVIYLTGRDEVCKDVTKQWMEDNHLDSDLLIMRPEGNNDKDDDLKETLYRERIEGHYNVIAVFEDRPAVIKRFREMGLFVLDVNQMNNFKEVF